MEKTIKCPLCNNDIELKNIVGDQAIECWNCEWDNYSILK